MATSKANKQVIVDFIINCIKKGEERGPVLAKVDKKWQVAVRTFDRYWKKAQEEHTAAQQTIKEELAKLDKQAAVDARKKAIMTAEDRKVLLTEIALGKVKIPTKEVKWNPVTGKFKSIPFVELPNHQARIKAIEELNKMDGEHKPLKVQNQTLGADGKPTNPQPIAVSLTLPVGMDINLPSNTDGEND